MGFGSGAFVFNFILIALVNPHNEKQINNLFPEAIGNNFPSALRILALIYAAIGAFGIAISVTPKKQVPDNPLL